MSSGTLTFSAMLSVGMRLNCWKTKPTSSWRRRARWSVLSTFQSTPKTSALPPSESSTPEMIETSVVLPHPEGPTSITSLPGATSRSMPRSACTAFAPEPKVLVTARRRTANPPAASPSAAACVPKAISWSHAVRCDGPGAGGVAGVVGDAAEGAGLDGWLDTGSNRRRLEMHGPT